MSSPDHSPSSEGSGEEGVGDRVFGEGNLCSNVKRGVSISDTENSRTEHQYFENQAPT